MLAVFESTIGKPPEALIIPSGWMVPETRFEVPEICKAAWRDTTFYNFPNGNFMAFSHVCENPAHPKSVGRSTVVMDDIFCTFRGTIDNIGELRRHYGLTRQATEAMLMVEIYKVYRDRAPYPPDQVIKDLSGMFAFVLFDANRSKLFVARDRDGKVKLHWGVTDDDSLVFCDDAEVILDVCGATSTAFPAGCIFMNSDQGEKLASFDHPLHKVRAIRRENDDGAVIGVFFQVDLFSRLPSIPRVGSEANWGDAAAPATE
ncbi:hypothetical protein Taro_021184 [Colocasia esculenta]|uniref:DUF3700 domain-containing protein n=1 Tax=Colocasia esculenta TaxID=4460 RepID=A0A843VAR1_COLES|nr:hypothetical protein [Colocasia esculenta]